VRREPLGGALASHVDEHDAGRFPDEMIMDGRDLDTFLSQFLDHWPQLLLREDEVSVHHHLMTDSLECEPASKSEPWFEWTRREQHLAHLRPAFGGMLAKAITTERLKTYVSKRLEEGAAPATINRELDCTRRMMVLGQRQSPPKVLHIPHFPKLTEDKFGKAFAIMRPICVFGARLRITSR
jgi:hypothetical protein